MKFIGINAFHELLVDDTGVTKEGHQDAIKTTIDKKPQLVEKLW